MRITLYPLAALSALLIGACSSGPVYTGPAPVRPLELTIVRPEYDKVLVQTNRYSYVAVFEILPDRGVSIVYPATARQAETLVGGMNWLPVALQPARVVYRGFPPRRVVRAHYLYAVASDRPIQLSDADYDPSYLRQELGDAAYSGENVAATMRALAREFVPVLPAEQWNDDSYALEEAQETPIVRVYCADGTSIEIRETIVTRVRCSTRPPVIASGGSGGSSNGGYRPPTSGPATAPSPTPRSGPSLPWGHGDSVAQAGTPRRDSVSNRRTPPVLRLPVDPAPPADSNRAGDSHGGDHGDHGDHGRGNGNGNGNAGGNGNGNAYGHDKDHGNGNAYGHENGNGQGAGSGNAGTDDHGRGGTAKPPWVPGGRGIGLGAGAPRNRPDTPNVGDANPHPTTPTGNGNGAAQPSSGGSPASSNGNAAHGNSGSAGNSGNTGTSGSANGNASPSGSSGNANPPAKGDDAKKAPPRGRGLIHAVPDSLKPKP